MAPHRFREQFEQIQRALPDVALALGPDDSAEFIYEKGVVLARDEEAGIVEDTVRRHFAALPDLDEGEVRRAGPARNRSGITRIRVGDPTLGERTQRAVADALRAVRAPEARAGRRLISRNHVVTIAVNSCPGDEPVPAASAADLNPAPADPGPDPENPVSVLVIDNGLTHDYAQAPLLAHVQGDLHATETDADGNLLQYIGHGTFIAGVLAAVAPRAGVTVRSTLTDAGAILESDFGEALFDAVDRDGWPDIISLSAGTSNGRTDGLLGVDAFMQELRQHKTLLVAAAGNNSSATPFWPAAYASLPEYSDCVLSVGALRTDGEFGACFTNHGGWVEAYAPGERLTSTLTGFTTPVPYVYQHSTYDECRYGFAYTCTCQDPQHVGALSDDDPGAQPDAVTFHGYAQWSGTSFATPVAAALVANLMAAEKEPDPRAAKRRLLAATTDHAEVRGGLVRALVPPTWRPTPAVRP